MFAADGRETNRDIYFTERKEKKSHKLNPFPKDQAQVATGRAGTGYWNVPKAIVFASICEIIKWRKPRDKEKAHLVSRMSSDTPRATQSGWRFLRSRRTRSACSFRWQHYSTNWGQIWHRFLPLWEAGRCSQLWRALRRRKEAKKKDFKGKKQSYLHLINERFT